MIASMRSHGLTLHKEWKWRTHQVRYFSYNSSTNPTEWCICHNIINELKDLEKSCPVYAFFHASHQLLQLPYLEPIRGMFVVRMYPKCVKIQPISITQRRFSAYICDIKRRKTSFYFSKKKFRFISKSVHRKRRSRITNRRQGRNPYKGKRS